MRRLNSIFSWPGAGNRTQSRFFPNIVNRSSTRCLTFLAIIFALGLGFTNVAHSDSYFYDPGGRLAGVIIQATGGSAQYQYDQAGNITSVTLQPSTAVTVLGFAPVAGPAGTSVTISGTGFGTTANTSVSFNGTTATVQSVSANSIVATVPAGATSGTISVTAPGGTATSEASFTISAMVAPTITSFTPALINPPVYDPTNQSWTAGDPVTVNGANFVPGSTKVYIGGRLAQASNVSAGSLTLTPPVVGSGFIAVVTPAGTATATTPVFVTPYINPLEPGSNILGLIDKSSIDAEQIIPLGTPTTLNYQAANHSVAAGFVALPPTGQVGPVQMLAEVSYTGATGAVGDPIYLVGPDGLQVFGQQRAISGSLYLLYTLTPNLTYTLFVGTPSGVQPTSATITIQNVPANATATVTPSTSGGVATVTLGSAYQGATVTFQPPADGDQVSLFTEEIGGTALNPFVVSLTAPDGFTQNYTNFPQTAPVGTPIASGTVDFSGARSVPQSGTYTITFQPQGTATGKAQFTLYDVPAAPTGALSVNTPLSLTTTVPGQSLQPTIPANTGQYLTLLTQVDSTLATNCFSVSIAAALGAPAYSNFQCGGATDFSGQVMLPSTAVPYTVTVTPVWTAVGQATFTLQTLPTPSAQPITIGGSPVAVTIQDPGQVGELSFAAGSGGQWVELTTGVSSGLSSQCLLVSITASNATSPLVSYDQCNQASQSLDGIFVPSGSYTITLTPIGQGTGTVTATLANGTPIPAGTIPPTGAPLATSIATAGSPFSLTFTGTDGGTISLATAPDFASGAAPLGGGNCYRVQVIAPDGSTVVYDTDGEVISACNAKDFSGPLSLPQTGQYTMTFTPPTNGTEMIVQQLFTVPANATGTISVNTAGVPLSLAVPGQAAVASFSVTDKGYVEAYVGADPNLAQDCYLISVAKVSGGTISSDKACGAQYWSGAIYLPSANAYQVSVTADGVIYGTASINVGSR